ncbi:type I secretion system permease/ATPase [Gymnodinialimonas ceratoperidinii]|uniref:Type I secretion system permease/ATPase n=1 Tax=Gymnodinialimonas ceratoperidinii TaxID=2856823 RepID=A0A8F6TVN3_9RHOB|nr:type I secretion system permease/ATPase [Gymnodinialimonas ceratoperidinii]QXT39792.1 type I secretion system permease/ATPase [Gymnodinialimonas ceratoperidinii]
MPPIAKDELAEFRRRNSWILGAVALFSLFVNLLMLTGPLFMLLVYERVLGSGSEETLLALSILVAFLFLMMGVLDYARARVAARFGARLQTAFDARVFRAAMARAQRTGEAQTALSDLSAVQRLMSSPVFMALFDLPFTPMFIIAIFMFHPWLGWLALGATLFLVAVTVLNRITTARPLAEAAETSRAADRMVGAMQSSAEVIRALGMRSAALDRWHGQRARALDVGMGVADRAGSFATLSKTLRLFLQSAILGLAALLVLRGELRAGAMIAGSILMGRALAPIDLAISQWPVIQEAARGWTRLRTLLMSEREAPARLSLPRPKAVLEVAGLTVAPPGASKPALRAISFRLQPGEAIGIIGPSGSGKTTLARALTGVWPIAGGSIRLDRATLNQYDPDVLGRLIGYLPQSVSLFDGTVADNIARLDAKPDAQAVTSAAAAAAADTMIRALPQGYDTELSGNGPSLSGGQVQRIGLARALYGDPVLLVLDEPNSALDHEGSEALNRAVREMKAAGNAVLIMAHRPNAIQQCDKLLVLSGGVVQAFGPRDEVLAKVLQNSAEVQRVTLAQAVGDLT